MQIENSPCRVLFLSAPFSGIEVHFRNLQRYAATRKGLEGHWVYLERPHSKAGAFASDFILFRNVLKLRKLAETCDAVVCNSIVPLRANSGIFRGLPLLLSLDATPALFHQFRQWYAGHPGRFEGLRRVAKQFFSPQSLLARVDHIFPWSGMVRDSLLSEYGVGNEKMTQIPPGVDTELWKRRSARENGAHRVQVLFVGGDFKRKGGDIALSLSREDEFRNFDFHFVTSKSEAGHYVADNVHFHTGVQANSQRLIDIYSQSDIYLLPTRADFAPTMALCEALAMEIPAIVSRVGGLEELVRDGETGYTAEVDQIDAIRERIRLLADNAELRHALGRKGRAIVRNSYDLATNATRFFEIVESHCVDHRRRKVPGRTPNP
jgi:glycosyltransferase involved in cell wall biosynthesis